MSALFSYLIFVSWALKMYINFVNRKSGKADQIKFGEIPLTKIKQLTATAAASTKHYLITLIAQNQEDIDFLFEHFSSIPGPPSTAKQAIWTGDLAVFIVLNYPNSEDISV